MLVTGKEEEEAQRCHHKSNPNANRIPHKYQKSDPSEADNSLILLPNHSEITITPIQK